VLRLYLIFQPPIGWFICYVLISWVISTSLFQTYLLVNKFISLISGSFPVQVSCN